MPTFVADEVVTAAKMNLIPKGVLDRAVVTADQGSITTKADLTGLTVTVDVAADRLIRVTGKVLASSTVAADQITGYIQESTTVLQRFLNLTVHAGARFYSQEGSVLLTPSVGSHTYKLTLERSVGTGTITMGANAAYPAFILVEDLGDF